MKAAMFVLRPLLARLSFAAALFGAAAHAGGVPPETPVHAELVRIADLFQGDRQAAITQLQALHDRMPADATLDDRSKTINTLVNFYIEAHDERARRYVDELAASAASTTRTHSACLLSNSDRTRAR